MTDVDLKHWRALADGFPGTFEFRPEHTEDRGVGRIADCVDVDDQLVYVSIVHDSENYVIADGIESHVGVPLAELLNAIPALLDLVDRLRVEREAIAADVAFMRGFGIALASIWKLHHDGQMVQSLIRSNGFTLESFRDVDLLDADYEAICQAVSCRRP